MRGFQEFSEPRLVACYDELNPAGPEVAYYSRQADLLGAASIADIGCGTGAVTCALVARGRRVVAVDPSRAMLSIAHERACPGRVEWIHGMATALRPSSIDLAIMTGHVPQIISEEGEWRDTLASIRRLLAPGGHFAFESRNPDARAWLRWDPIHSRRVVISAMHGRIDTWHELRRVRAGLVRYDIRYRLAGGDVLTSENTLRFRTQRELEMGLNAAGFDVLGVLGDWDGSAPGATRPELIFLARRR